MTVQTGGSPAEPAPASFEDAQPDLSWPERAESARGEITRLLDLWSKGDQDALERLMTAVYGELTQLAASYLRRERAGHTLQTSALIHEAFLRLVDQRRVRWRNRSHFFGVAAQAMRRVLIDYARYHRGFKRGGDRRRLSLEEICELSVERLPELEALDDALRDLAALDPEQAKVVEMRYFAGLSNEEIATILGQSTRTVTRRWRMARAWLYLELNHGEPNQS